MSIKLMYSRSNQAFVFARNNQPINLPDERTYFGNKADALKAAGRHRMSVDAQGNVSAAGGLEGARKYNQKAYTHYVVVWPSDMPEPRGTVSGSERPGARIDSGWEFREDAKDRYTEVSESEDMKAKIVAKVSLKSWGLNPDSNDDWITSEGFSEHVTGPGDPHSKSYRDGYYTGETDVMRFEMPRVAAGDRSEWARGYMAAWNDHKKSAGLEGGVSPKTRVGTRVRFQPTPASLPLYSNPPARGEEGEVTSVSFGGGVKKSFLPGPGGGLLYVKWDRIGVQGVSPIDVVKASGRSGMHAGPGKPGMKFERDDVEITTTLHPLQLDGVSKSSKLHSLDKFTEQYIATALWSTNDESNDSGGMPFDENYGPSDLTNEALDKMIRDCQAFQKENAVWLSEAGNDSQNGHDFWLTRNGHGAGYWDRDYSEDVSEGLSKAAKEYGTVNLYLSNGKIHHD